MTAQASLVDWIAALDHAGLLYRVTDEKRVDELPQLMEDHPDQAILVEKVADCAFPFLANAMGSRAMCALALGCDPREVNQEVGRRSIGAVPPQVVDTAPCKDVVVKGDDVDLTIFPLFLHHTHDGQAYLNDGRIITKHPDTGQVNDAVQRLMYRARNMLSIDERAVNHAGSINGTAYHERRQDMPVAICLGGPTLDQVASMMRLPGSSIDAWERLGNFYGAPAQLVKCETVDLTVPANAEIVLEGHVITSEDFVHDEGPYGEAPGTYGGQALAHNWNLRVDCVTYRKDAVYQHATIGGMHPGRTDMFVWPLAIEGELFETLKRAGITVLDVYMPPGSCENVIYARIKPVSGGDAKQALGTMLTACRQQFPKVAYVFDEDIDIYDDEQVKWAQAWRFNPGTDTVLIPGQNLNPLDPSLPSPKPPYIITKIGLDCTMAVGEDHAKYARALVTPPIPQPAQPPQALDDDALKAQLTDFIKQAPRSWRDIVTHFAGQPYRTLYRAFGDLRPQLGRMADQGPDYPYVFSTTGDFVQGGQQPAGKT